MPDPLAPTADHAPPATTVALTRPMTATPPAAGFEEATRALLRVRLLFFHLVLGGYYALLLLLGFFDAHPYGRLLGGVAVAEAWGGAFYLWRRPAARLGVLRAVELAHFGLVVGVVGTGKYSALLAAPAGEADGPFPPAVLAGTATNLPFLLLAVAYGALIPNPRRRCLAVVGGFALAAVGLTAAAVAARPALRPAGPVLLVQAAVHLTLGGAVAVYSAGRFYGLRREVFEARRAAGRVGPYTLTEKLGAGGMGEVWLAEHRLLKRPCAIKFVRPEFAANPAAAARFDREVRAVTTLTHPNTVRVYDYGRADDGSFYAVMEYLPGPTLAELVDGYGEVPPGRAVYLVRQVCGALAEAHAAGLVHRDVKPSNVLVASLGGQPDVAKLLDFGLVHDLAGPDDGRLTRTGAVLGTPAYMCPEQAGGDEVDARGDLYSLGAVLFFLLTGRPPFDAPTAGRLLAAHLTEPPPRLTDLRPELPLDLSVVVARCLAKRPADRFASAAELDAALAACGCAADWSAGRAAAWWAEATQPTVNMTAK